MSVGKASNYGTILPINNIVRNIITNNSIRNKTTEEEEVVREGHKNCKYSSEMVKRVRLMREEAHIPIKIITRYMNDLGFDTSEGYINNLCVYTVRSNPEDTPTTEDIEYYREHHLEDDLMLLPKTFIPLEDREGSILPTNKSGNCVVLEYSNCRDVLVKFENTGNIKSVSWDSLIKGSVKDRGDSDGKLVANRTKTGRLYYTDKHIKDYYQE